MPERVTQADPANQDLDAADQAWLRRRFAGAPLLFGAAGIVTAPLLIGLLLGPLGLRAGVDLWRAGARRGIVAAGIAVSFMAIVASVIAALIWGSVLATVLLGRDAMRETERWRTREVEQRALTVISADGAALGAQLVPTGPWERTVVLFVAGGGDFTAAAIAHTAAAARAHPTCRLIVADPTIPSDELRAFVRRIGVTVDVLGEGAAFPAPLDAVAAFPTLVVIGRDGRIESALVGDRTEAELERVFSGVAAPSAPPESPK